MTSRPTPRRRTAAALAALGALAWLAAGLASAGPAHAHAALASSDPAADEVLDAAPDEITLVFTEQIAPPAFVTVHGPDEAEISTGEVRVGNGVVKRSMDDAGEGTYTVAYRVVSADGHPISGQYEFAVGAPSSAAAASEPADEDADNSSALLFGAIGAAALAVIVGLALWRRRQDRSAA